MRRNLATNLTTLLFIHPLKIRTGPDRVRKIERPGDLGRLGVPSYHSVPVPQSKKGLLAPPLALGETGQVFVHSIRIQ